MTPTALLTDAPTGTVLFISPHPELWLTREQSFYRFNHVGHIVGTTPRLRYEFSDHRLVVAPGQDMRQDGPPDPETGEATMQDAVAWLRSHHLNGDKFHEQGSEPGRMEDPADALDALFELAHAFDVEGLEALIAGEMAGAAREIVLDTARRQLSRVRAEVQAAGRAEPAADAGTPGNAAESDDLNGLDFAALREVGRPLGLAFKPGTTKANAAAAIREARAAQE